MPDRLYPMHSFSPVHPPNSPPVKVLKLDYHFVPSLIGGSSLPLMRQAFIASWA